MISRCKQHVCLQTLIVTLASLSKGPKKDNPVQSRAQTEEQKPTNVSLGRQLVFDRIMGSKASRHGPNCTQRLVVWNKQQASIVTCRCVSLSLCDVLERLMWWGRALLKHALRLGIRCFLLLSWWSSIAFCGTSPFIIKPIGWYLSVTTLPIEYRFLANGDSATTLPSSSCTRVWLLQHVQNQMRQSAARAAIRLALPIGIVIVLWSSWSLMKNDL